MNKQFFLLIIIFGVFLCAGPVSNTASAATYTVTNTSDSDPGSLRDAITSANANPGADLIEFNISGGGVQTITPLTPLPTITEAVTIDGYTQPGSSKNTLADGDNAVLLIEISGANAGATATGLIVNASNVTISGLVINRFSQYGISITGAVEGMTISGNFIGTNPSGTAAGPGNAWTGIILNSGAGIVHTIGGELPWQRNVISGNVGGGIALYSLEQTIIKGNYIGTNAAGTQAIANTGSGGIIVMSSGHTIGGRTPGARNLISGNNRDGIYVANAIGGGTTQNVVIEGNYIGTDFSGTSAIPNFNSGIYMFGAGVNVSNNRIGGTEKGSGNVISGNGATGIALVAQVSGGPGSVTGNLVQGNFVGVDAHGSALPNNWTGVWLSSLDPSCTVNGNTIGGSEAGANTIAYNNGNGVKIAGDTSTKNTILYNSIFSNTELGIDLGGDTFASVGDGITGNDAGDVDAGPNNRQNFPVLTAAQTACGYINIRGTLNSTASTAYTIQLFANTACDSAGNGEGATYLGQTTATTDGFGNGTFSVILPDAAAGNYITATATDLLGNTSEFSACGIVASGTQLTVNSTLDVVDANTGDGICLTAGGLCTLRAAVQQANTASGFSCISVPAGIYPLTLTGDGEDDAATGDLDIRSNMVIVGAGVESVFSSTYISGQQDRVFHVDPSASGIAAGFSGLWITGGLPPGVDTAGGDIANNGSLLIEKCRISSGTATFGGGIYNQGSTVVNNSVISLNNAAFGAGIYTKWGTFRLTSSTIEGNTASGKGAGMNVYIGSNLEISGSTVTDNVAWNGLNEGGGINIEAGTVAITNSTISGNDAPNTGGGINAEAGSLTITNSTITNNGIRYGGGGLNVKFATGTVTNTIISWNTGDCRGGTLTSGGHNLSFDVSCGFTSAGDMMGTDPLLGPLANNSGPTLTHALLSGSPAIDAGTSVGAPATDQRGIARPYGAAVDIGAYEFIPSGSAPVRIAGVTPVYYPTIQSAYDAAVNGDTLEVQGTDFAETVLFNRATNVMFRGGYDSGFFINNLMTRLTGSASFNSGSIAVENLSIQ
ncbi:MAG: hypothetical protein C0402_07410 [Thermodesulfovibrio sp.]|nr:hypothetical protein [Thermodesulfovibrio sp.]